MDICPSSWSASLTRRRAAWRVENIARTFEPELIARDLDLRQRLFEVVGEGLQVLEHESLIWVRNVSQVEVGYAPRRRGRAALEADAVEQTLSGESAETA